MNSITIRGRIASKKDVLSNPDKYQNERIVIFDIANEDHYQVIKQFHREWKTQMHKNLMLSIGFAEEGFMVKATNLYFAMRDQLAKHMGDTSRANKDSIHHGLILDCEFRHTDGRLKESIKELDRRELWELIQRVERELNETEYTYEFTANVNDLARDYTGHL